MWFSFSFFVIQEKRCISISTNLEAPYQSSIDILKNISQNTNSIEWLLNDFSGMIMLLYVWVAREYVYSAFKGIFFSELCIQQIPGCICAAVWTTTKKTMWLFPPCLLVLVSAFTLFFEWICSSTHCAFYFIL